MEIQFKSGKELPVADTLSRAFIPAKEGDTENETEYQVHLVMSSLPISNSQLNRFRQETTKDQTLQSLKEVIRTGWPERKDTLANEIKPFFIVRDEITEIDGLLIKGERVIVPTSLRNEMKARIHEGYLGIEKCKARARDVMYWPGINNEITEMVQRCSVCHA